jgi:hypothetical protein
MKKFIAIAMAGALFAAGSAFAADPVIGTWKLNVAKSKFSPGPAPKALTRVYTESGGTYTLESTSTDADGKESTTRVQYRDGEEDKVSSPGIDAIDAKKADDRTWHFELKSGGKVVGHVDRVVSADGKTLSVHNTGKQLSGPSSDDRMVFEKQ